MFTFYEKIREINNYDFPFLLFYSVITFTFPKYVATVTISLFFQFFFTNEPVNIVLALYHSPFSGNGQSFNTSFESFAAPILICRKLVKKTYPVYDH